MTLRVGLYCRISADREGRELGVDRQQQDGRAYVAQRGWTLVDIYVDNDASASAKSTKPRPDYRRLLGDARSGRIDCILAYTSGRLTRRSREFEDQIDLAAEFGTRFEYLRSPSFDLNTAAGRRIARTMAAQDIGEAEDIAERAQRAKLQAAEAGLPSGGRRPFGYEPGGMIVRESEAELVRSMCTDLLAGTSLNEVCRRLNESGIQTSANGEWRQDTVRRLLLRHRNVGRRVHRGEDIGPAAWPAILETGVWEAVVALLADPARRTNFTVARRWLGAGLFMCHCGATVRISRTTNARPQAKAEYVCNSGVKHLTRNAQAVDDLVALAVIDRMSRLDARELLDAGDTADEAKALRAEAKTRRARMNELASMFGEGVIDARQLSEGTRRGRARLEAIEQQLADLRPARRVLALLVVDQDEGDGEQAVREAVAAKWEEMDLGKRRTAVDSLMTVILLPSPKGRPKGWRPGSGAYLRPETVLIKGRE